MTPSHCSSCKVALYSHVEFTLSQQEQHHTSDNYWRSCPVWGRGTPSPFPLVHLLRHLLFFFYFSLSFIGFTYFLLLSIPSLSTRIVPLRFQAGGRRKRPNLGLVCFVCVICIPYFRCILVFCCIWFSLVLCVFLQCFDTVGWVIWSVKTRPRYDL